jgi:phosphate starvation-inducible PhoH-like protein
MTIPTKKTKTKIKTAPKKEELDKISSVTFVGDSELVAEILPEDLTKIRKAFGVSIENKSDKFYISSDNIENCRKAASVLEKLFDLLDSEIAFEDEDVDRLILELLPKPFPGTKYKGFFTTFDGKEISPRTLNQEKIIHTIKNKTISVIHNYAGTGKTKLALIAALKFIFDGRYDKLIVVRSTQTVGKEMGFLPGNLDEKFGAYVSPIVDTLHELLGEKKFEEMVASKKIVFSPIAFFRGVNIENSIMMIDEAQNTTKHEILTLLTRLGTLSKIIITGDSNQNDFKDTKIEKTGLDCVIEYLSDLEDVGFVEMKLEDIQRNKLVGQIISAFE